jgi:hypothetical protein
MVSKFLVVLPRINEFGEQVGPSPTEEIIGTSALVTYSGSLIIKDKRGLVKAYAPDRWEEVERFHEKDDPAEEDQSQDQHPPEEIVKC